MELNGNRFVGESFGDELPGELNPCVSDPLLRGAVKTSDEKAL